MKNWIRVLLVCFVLVGGTMSFGYWSINQFDDALDNLTASLVVIIPPVNPQLTVSETSTSASSTPPTNQNDLDSKFQLIFSPKKNGVYVGCTYEISWLASTTIKSLETALIDAGTRKPIGPIASRLAKENNIEANSQNLKWKVGVVWPGEYFISISNVNGVAIDERSRKFMINEISNGSDKKEQKNLCEETGGNLF
ncbi:MAG: hypothetical protein Q7K16_04120 [Candidatus Azambacteria bacterium]|nr:hypothetical protein [Candidatus Azambacteria bacterium]